MSTAAAPSDTPVQRLREPLATALLLGALADLLLRDGPGALGGALWVLALLAALLTLARRTGRTITVGAALLAALAALLALSLAWRDAPTLVLLDGAALAAAL